MNLDPRRHRKLDFFLVAGAILLLWGPGAALSPGDGTRGAPVQAAVATSPDGTAAPPAPPEPRPVPAPAPVSPDRLARIQATITGYSSSALETDSTPGLTAARTEARQGVIALSQDLLREYTPGAPFTFHDQVEIPGLGRFRIEDTMHPRWTRRADVWFASREQALRWGRRTRYLYRLPDNLAQALLLPGSAEVAATFGQANFQ